MKNFTLIEMMIIAVFGLILFSAILAFSGADPKEFSFGINGITETRCINGVQFIVGQDGRPVQVIGADGKGVACK